MQGTLQLKWWDHENRKTLEIRFNREEIVLRWYIPFVFSIADIFFLKISHKQHTREDKQVTYFGWRSYYQAFLKTLKIEEFDVLKEARQWVNQPKHLTYFILSFILCMTDLEKKIFLQSQMLLLAKQVQGYMTTWNFKENLVLEWRNNNPWLH